MIHKINRSTILAAISQVEEAFPFKDYIAEGGKHGLVHIVQQIVRHKTQGRLLDIGCGPMDKTCVFQELGFECYAVDDLLDPWHRRNDNIAKILEFAKQMGINLHMQPEADNSIPFPKDYFDVVTIFDVIEHLHESPNGILSTAGLHLKGQGILCMTTPNAVNIRKRLSVLLGKTNYPPIDQFFLNPGRWRGHVREYTLSEMVYMCRTAGFQVLTASPYESIAYDKLPNPFLSMYLLFTRMIPTLRSSLCVVALKPEGWIPFELDPVAYRKVVAGSVPTGVR